MNFLFPNYVEPKVYFKLFSLLLLNSLFNINGVPCSSRMVMILFFFLRFPCSLCSFITFEGVRRLLEEDLGLAKYALDAYKSFVRECLAVVGLLI